MTTYFLDYRTEPLRHAELKEATTKLKDLFSKRKHQIWTGDFNALTKSDYDEPTWNEIARIRKKNNWESPQTSLTTEVKISLYE